MNQAKKVLITGGSGFVGHTVIKNLLAHTNDHLVLLKNKNEFPESIQENSRVTCIPLKLENLGTANLKEIKHTIADCNYLIHLAGFVSRKRQDNQKLMELHVTASHFLLNLISESKINKIILLATSGVVGINRDFPRNLPNDESPYAIEIAFRYPYYASKILQEKIFRDYARKNKKQVISLRPSLILGTGDEKLSSTADIIHILQGKRPLRPRGGLSLVDVENVSQAILRSLEYQLPSSDNNWFRSYLLGAGNLLFTEFIDLVEEIGGTRNPHFQIPRIFNKGLSWVIDHSSMMQEHLQIEGAEMAMADLFWYIDSQRAINDLGLQFNPVRQVIEKTIEDLRKRNLF